MWVRLCLVQKKLGVSCCIPREWWLDGIRAPRSTSKEVNSSSVGSDLCFSQAKLPPVSFRCLDTNQCIITIYIIIIIKTTIIIITMTAVQRWRWGSDVPEPANSRPCSALYQVVLATKYKNHKLILTQIQLLKTQKKPDNTRPCPALYQLAISTQNTKNTNHF